MNTVDSEALPTDTAPTDTAPTDRATRTFAFEVTAGRTARATDADLPLSATPRPKFLEHLPVVSPTLPVVSAKEVTSDQPTIDLPVLQEQTTSGLSDRYAPIVIRPATAPRRMSSWWFASLGTHIALILGLAFLTLAAESQEEAFEFIASSASYETLEELQDFDITPTELTEPQHEDHFEPLDLLDTDSLSLTNSTESLPLDEPILNPIGTTDMAIQLVEVGEIFGDGLTSQNNNGLEQQGEGEAIANFFGTQIKARRILYILDNSGGMRKGGKFESLVNELQQSVGQLHPSQKFYVIFYSDTAYPMFYPHSATNFVSATPQRLENLGHWLDTVELCMGNAIDEAFHAAAAIRPDAVFLLTDGNLFTTAKKKAMLLNHLNHSYPIYTFGLGVSTSSKTAENLRQVAEANGGTFRSIKVTADMKAAAKEKERPYHKTPGKIWGRKVSTWR